MITRRLQRAHIDATEKWSYGFAIGPHMTYVGATTRSNWLTQMKNAQAGWMRIDASWSTIMNGGPTSYNWTPLDNAVQDSINKGFKVLLIPAYTPVWARPAGTSETYAPTNIADYANFVTALVQRFYPRVKHYELWNEPNLVNFWKDTVANPKPNIARYTQLLKQGYLAAKAVTTDTTIITAGLAGMPDAADGTSFKSTTFLQGMYTNGAKNHFDAVAQHPYSFPAMPSENEHWSNWSQMYVNDFPQSGIYGTPSLRSIMIANGDGNKKIWMTEFGGPTSGTNSWTEAQQAQATQQAITLNKTFSWAGPLFLYTYPDLAPVGNTTDREYYFGIVRYDGSPKPAYTYLQNM